MLAAAMKTTQALAPLLDDEPMSPRQILFSFEGRVPRRIWWLYGFLAMLVAGAFINALLMIAGFDPGAAESVVNVLLLWPIVAVSVKRWHDRDKSAWWVLVMLLPVIGWLWTMIENGFLRGTEGDNTYGPDLTDKF